MPILSMRLSDAKRGGSSATPMGHRACSPRVPLATTADGDHPDSCGAEAEEAATTREGQTSRVVDHRRRFWAEFREGQRQADASCLEADRVLKQDQ